MLAERLARAITLGGPIPVAQFMAAANAHYYATRDPLGADGDFTTAPEISQMFGELIGAWAADLWERAGRPEVAWVELGPGRGTLSADALRVMAKAGLTPPVHFVETSPVLRAAQAERVPGAIWHDGVETLPDDRPLIVVANEFFDALPIRQLVKRTSDGWRERLVACQDLLFLPIAGRAVPDAIIPPHLRDAPAGQRDRDFSPRGVNVMRALSRADRGARAARCWRSIMAMKARRWATRLQAVRGHAFANPYDEPGERDLTAHVDFGTLAAAARESGCAAHGPVAQGAWLTRARHRRARGGAGTAGGARPRAAGR